MSSIQGTDTGYSAIAGNYLALAPECSDTIFGTNINYCKLVHDGTMKNGFLDGKFVDGYENDPYVISKYMSLRNEFNTNLSKDIKLEKGTIKNIYQLLHTIPETSEIAKIVDYADFGNKLESSTFSTFIAPSNSAVKKAKNTWLNTNSKGVLRSLLDAHLLNFLLPAKKIENRLLRVNTANPAFWFTADGTAQISKGITFYQKPYELLTDKYSLPYDRFNVEKIYVTDNGAIYVIDGMFSPDIILYKSVF
jgi:hypothetical protein